VLVVGAGLAGLAAALELEDHGMSVAVLEGRDRVGGRVWSTTLTNGAVVELGAEWIMETDDEVLGAADRFDLSVAETGADYRRREAWGPGAVSLPDQDDFLASVNQARAALGDEEAGAFTLGDFLDAVPGDDAARAVLKARLAGTCAQDLALVTLRITDGERAFSPGAGHYFRLRAGNQRLPEAMAQAVDDVRLGRVVDAVSHDAEGVTVHLGEQEERAEAMVLAVPAPIAARLRVTPALPAALATALDELPMGVASKFAVATEKRPTLRSRQSSQRSMWCWAANDEDGRTRRCVASFAGSPAVQEELGITRGRATPWLEALQEMNPDLEFQGEPVMYAWADDPFTLGAYSAWDAASWDRADVFSTPVGRIAFAGEHTGGHADYATMNAAIRSGRRAAQQVLSMLPA
jgi:monoamine oxidase